MSLGGQEAACDGVFVFCFCLFEGRRGYSDRAVINKDMRFNVRDTVAGGRARTGTRPACPPACRLFGPPPPGSPCSRREQPSQSAGLSANAEKVLCELGQGGHRASVPDGDFRSGKRAHEFFAEIRTREKPQAQSTWLLPAPLPVALPPSMSLLGPGATGAKRGGPR